MTESTLFSYDTDKSAAATAAAAAATLQKLRQGGNAAIAAVLCCAVMCCAVLCFPSRVQTCTGVEFFCKLFASVC